MELETYMIESNTIDNMKKIVHIVLILISVVLVSCKNSNTNSKTNVKTPASIQQELQSIEPKTESGIWFVQNHGSEKYYPGLTAKYEGYTIETRIPGGHTFQIRINGENGLPTISTSDETVKTELSCDKKEPITVSGSYENPFSSGFYVAIYREKTAYDIIKFLQEAESDVTFKFTGVNKKNEPTENVVTIPMQGFKEVLKCWIDDLTKDGDKYYGLNTIYPTE